MHEHRFRKFGFTGATLALAVGWVMTLLFCFSSATTLAATTSQVVSPTDVEEEPCVFTDTVKAASLTQLDDPLIVASEIGISTSVNSCFVYGEYMNYVLHQAPGSTEVTWTMHIPEESRLVVSFPGRVCFKQDEDTICPLGTISENQLLQFPAVITHTAVLSGVYVISQTATTATGLSATQVTTLTFYPQVDLAVTTTGEGANVYVGQQFAMYAHIHNTSQEFPARLVLGKWSHTGVSETTAVNWNAPCDLDGAYNYRECDLLEIPPGMTATYELGLWPKQDEAAGDHPCHTFTLRTNRDLNITNNSSTSCFNVLPKINGDLRLELTRTAQVVVNNPFTTTLSIINDGEAAVRPQVLVVFTRTVDLVDVNAPGSICIELVSTDPENPRTGVSCTMEFLPPTDTASTASVQDELARLARQQLPDAQIVAYYPSDFQTSALVAGDTYSFTITTVPTTTGEVGISGQVIYTEATVKPDATPSNNLVFGVTQVVSDSAPSYHVYLPLTQR